MSTLSTLPLKQNSPLQMYSEARVDIWNSAVALCEALSHANPPTPSVQNPTHPCQRSLVCLQPPSAHRLRLTIRRSGDPSIFPSLPSAGHCNPLVAALSTPPT